MNSAAYLLKFFLDESDDEQFYFVDLSAAMVGVDEVLKFTAANGDEEAGSASKCLQYLWQCVEASFRTGTPVAVKGSVSLRNDGEMALRIAKRLLGDKVNTYPQERRDGVQELVSSLPDALKTLSVPSELKQYVLLLAREVQSALDWYEETGDFKLDVAFSKLQSALFVVVTSSTEPEQRSGFLNFLKEKLLPCITAVSLLLGVPKAAIDDINLFAPQIGHSNQQESTE